jgi:hypothetical protein
MEELEEVIAPIAPDVVANHNETLTSEEVEPGTEEQEEVIVPYSR